MDTCRSFDLVNLVCLTGPVNRPNPSTRLKICKNHQLRASGDIIGAASEHRSVSELSERQHDLGASSKPMQQWRLFRQDVDTNPDLQSLRFHRGPSAR